LKGLRLSPQSFQHQLFEFLKTSDTAPQLRLSPEPLSTPETAPQLRLSLDASLLADML
jgi:hypothetical protein